MSGSIRRQKSGRDPRKAENQRLNLGSQVTAREPQSYNLVVCGATFHEEGFIFSDFMGFCMALREHGVGGDFLSCFPLEEHFMWLQNENSPPITTIKFGKLGPNNDKALYTYSRHQFVNRQYWWTQVAHHQLLEKVQNWISVKKQQAVAGDVVNIILEGHGTYKGEYCIGSRRIHPYAFRDLLSGFKDGVQVNAVSGACHSGQFIDAIKTSNQKNRYLSVACAGDEVALATTRSLSNRVRNSRFSHAFVQSLARISLPGVTRRRITWRIQDHENFMREQLTRNLTPGSSIISPQFHASEPVNGITLVENLIFRDKADIVYDPSISSRRRRPEWPTTDIGIQNYLSANPDGSWLSTTVREATTAIIDNEVSKCDLRSDLKSDISVFNNFFVKHPNWRLVMRNLYWRARRQSAIWDVFELLVMRGFLDPKCLTVPINILSMSPDTGLVSKLLNCFSHPSRDIDLIFENKIPFQPTSWDADINW